MGKLDKHNMIRLMTLGIFAIGLLLAKDPGINAFYKGDYKKAGDYYENRLNKDKENEKIMYNSGTTALAQKEYEKANSLLMQSLAGDDHVQLAKAHYNLGQLALQQQKTDEALDHFKKSMIYDPEDMNSKIMYENLRRMQEQQKQQQNQNKDQNKEQEQKQNQDQQKQNKNQKQEQDQQQDQQQDQDKQKQDQQQQQSQLSEEDLQAQELTKEQAKNILNAMKEEEKESMKKMILSKAKSKKIKRSKEW
ncbi:MAG: tetratricopeptide repeat protein [Candidatus Marinimicrobia bacterium]|nr:tetratricopeptide repeat protein [Candidatus Neomarinimicrobiota bacterium]